MDTIPGQLDVYDVLELQYEEAERAGMRLDSAVCPDCPCIADCQAEGECVGRAWAAVDGELDLPEWDAAS